MAGGGHLPPDPPQGGRGERAGPAGLPSGTIRLAARGVRQAVLAGAGAVDYRVRFAHDFKVPRIRWRCKSASVNVRFFKPDWASLSNTQPHSATLAITG